MKKLLLLSAATSAVLMAGGTISPAEPVVEPVVVDSGWDFSGQTVFYYQTSDKKGASSLFKQQSSLEDFGIQLRAVNKDLFAGIGAGVELSGLSGLKLTNWMVSNTMQGRDSWISQMYLTYGVGNTTFKLGRQELPKALSPFAFSEGWNVFKNTFDAALVVNTDLPDTTLVGAWVAGSNHNGIGAGTNDMTRFASVNDSDGIYMLTLQNKSIDGLALTGTYYYAPSYVGTDDAHILWGDAKFKVGDYSVAAQLGTVMSDGFTNDTFAWGLKAGGNFGMFDASIAYSSVDDGDQGLFNVGGVKTPLYTQMILNQDAIRTDSDTFVVRAGVKALGGKFGFAYGYSDMNDAVRGKLVDGKSGGAGTYNEVDLTYKTKVFNDSTTLFAGYIYQNRSYDEAGKKDWSNNVVRFWARYNF